MSQQIKDEIVSLSELSARIGRNTLLTQANTGNVSCKDGRTLWIKASGTWLSHAGRRNIFMRLDLDWARECARCGLDPAKHYAGGVESHQSPSVETALHVVLPHRIVIHVHSVNVIAWAVRRDGPACLAERLDGLRWRWIPYLPSGLPLASAVQKASAEAPDTDVFILANHGLVVGGRSCARAEALLREVERRVAVTARPCRKPDLPALRRLVTGSDWRPASHVTIHALGTDPESARILSGGVLYPCQALFTTWDPASLYRAISDPLLLRLDEAPYRSRPFLIVQDGGVLTRSALSPAGAAILSGLAQVIRRIPAYAAVRYLTGQEVTELDMQSYALASECSAVPAPAGPPEDRGRELIH